MNISFPTWETVPPDFQIPEIQNHKYLKNGELLEWTGKTEPIFSPICLEGSGKAEPKKLGYVPSFTESEALSCLDSGFVAYEKGPWPKMTVSERIKAVQSFAIQMKEKKDIIVKLLVWEIGKTLKDSEKEFDRTIDYIDDTISALKDQDRGASRFVFEKGIIAQIKRAPLGVVLCMGPFNYPLNETFCTLIPALIMGNTVLLKPAKYGVLLMEPLLTCFQKAFPPGVVNTLYGQGSLIVPPLMRTGKINVLAFIGSSKTVNHITKEHPKPNRLRSILGLNAKNPAILLPDVDFSETISEMVSGALSFNGQRCTALKIFFVPRSRTEDFLTAFCSELKKWKPGMPWEKDVQLTPLPELGKIDWLKEILKDAVSKGAKVINDGGGESLHTFMHPAVLFPVSSDMRIYHEEQFGPLVPIVPYDDIKEVFQYLEESDMGQQASVFGKDAKTIGELIDILVNQVSRINLNTQCQRGPDTFPFTGRKDSAEGTLSVIDALRSFSIRSLVAAKDLESQKELIRNILTEKTSKFLNTDFIL
jgi:glyceraldehyde-3-phosphate dehydrogenase (NADP+)